VGLIYADVKRGVARNLVQSCGREQSLEEREKAASVGRNEKKAMDANGVQLREMEANRPKREGARVRVAVAPPRD